MTRGRFEENHDQGELRGARRPRLAEFGDLHASCKKGNSASARCPVGMNGAGSAHWYLDLAPGFGVPAPC
jgi:hypothetical protein